ncbi:MAG TPA: protein kinase [Vicinamibacterales bacterium]|nr:protein kinase [Vicinamibacterales bacterium]
MTTMSTVFQRVGPFEIIEELGRGGMAAVYLAQDTRTGQTLALKLVPVRQDREHQEILEAERWGATLQAELSSICPLVPRIFEQGDVPPRYYFIAMEYVEGENLSDLLARGPLEPSRATRIAIDLCRFLEAAHGFTATIDGRSLRSLVHGDLKPRNVRLAAAGGLKVLDFGIAKALSLSRRVTRNDFGSMPYLSPERLDSVEVDAHADLWALGVILHEMLAAAPPFQARDTRRLEAQIRAGYLRRSLPAVPAGLRAIVAQLLAHDVGRRYATATEVREDLQRCEEGGVTAAEQAGWAEPGDDEATRRTRPATDGDQATRRTTNAAPALAGPVRRLRARFALPRVPGVSRRSVRMALMLLVLFLVLNEVRVGVAAGRIADRASSRDLDGLAAVWSDYDALTDSSYLGVGVLGLQRALRGRVQQLADQVIAEYRAGLPTIRERQWKAAQFNLQQALGIEPGDRRTRGAVRYCEGHLRRIDGEAAKSRGQTIAASRHFMEAIAAFREAAELRPDWPDPFLGLARTFIYGIEDMDRAADALKQAQRLGYEAGDRETAQLADGYRARAVRLTETARQLRDLPQEPEYLRRSLDAYREALSLYERIPAYPGVARQLRRIRDAINAAGQRLAEIELLMSGDAPEPPQPPARGGEALTPRREARRSWA